MVKEVTDKTFDRDIIADSKDSLVLVDYYSNYCKPCKRLLPKLENIKSKNPANKIVKINIDDNIESSIRNMIRTIPTLVVYKNGEVVDKLIGCSTISEEDIEKLLVI